MKKNLFYLFALICSMSLFTACSDDDEAPGNSGVVGEVVGDYKGLMDVYYEDPDLEIAKDMQQKITIKKSSDTSIGLELKNFVITINNTPLPIGDIAVENCPLKVEGDKYLFTGNADLDLIVGKCAVSVEGAINGEAIELIIKVNVDNGSMKVRVEYKGHKMTGNESSEALIKEFKFDSDIIAEQPVINEDKTITFKVAETATDDDLKALKPIITISENATVTPESGVAQDFSGNKVVIYKVTSEDGTTVTEYKVSARKSSDALITSFVFENNPIVAEQPVINEDNTIIFKVKASATADDLKALVPTITYSHKATIAPESGVAQDFSDNKKVIYTVTSEDGTVVKEYQVFISGTVENKDVYDFEAWAVPEDAMYKDVVQPTGWATCNDAVALIKNMGSLGGIVYKGAYPVRETSDCVSGEKALLAESVDTKGGTLLGQKVPKVTAGTAFLGTFNAFAALGNPMSATSFGNECLDKPLEVKGHFKYIAGTDFYTSDGQLDKSRKDKCTIAAVLYEVDSNDDTLNGDNIYNSPKIVAKAMLNSEGQAEYTPFSLKLEYIKEYDVTKKYKFAVIFSASEDGAKYNAAIGSKLYIDDVEIINE